MILAPEYVVRIGFICGDHRDPLFHSQSEQPYMIERKLIAFGMQRGFLMAALIGMDIVGHGDLSVTRGGTARFAFD